MGAKSSMIHALFLLASLSVAKLPCCCRSLSFSYNFSDPATFNRSDIAIDGSANLDGLIELTQNADPKAKDVFDKAGRASYNHPVLLWDDATGEVTIFSTRFSFVIMLSSDDSKFAPSDGLAFYMSPYPPTMPPFEGGGFLGLFTNSTAMNSSAAAPVVAVEFDTFQNYWDQSNDDHIGIDVNSINSTVVEPLPYRSLSSGTEPMVASVSYNSSTRMLTVVLQMGPKDGGMRYELNSTVDLKSLLPAQVAVGFSAASGWSVELHRVLTWSFYSTLVPTTQEPRENATRGKVQPGENGLVGSKEEVVRHRRPVAGVVVGVVLASVVVVGATIWFLVMRRCRISSRRMREEYEMGGGSDECDMNVEFEQGTGPRRFLYAQLATATNNFSEDGKLGEGGFGSVYRGLLSEPAGLEVAVKRISKTSKQGRKEYASEVKIISQLRHRNLVQLVGWCHGRGDFLLVYELVPNGSLDAHLYGGTDGGSATLPWPTRYEIALGLGSALLYLHSGYEKCVVHRDIKPSNIMLDSSFGAKLGDFGLAKLVEHGDTSQTTVLAGTMGYMDPEYAASGKASTASDVYSFGIVLLEMCCGRRPVLLQEQSIKSRLLEWVWDLHGRGAILEAADKRLHGGEFDGKQMECVMVVGLWCAHPDRGVRPSIKQALGALQFEAPLPALPLKMPVPTYSSPSPALYCNAAAASSSNGNNSSSAGFSSSTSGERSSTSSSAAAAESSWLLKQQQGQ